MLVLAPVASAQRPPDGERVLAQRFCDPTVLPPARRGPEWATVNSTREASWLVVRTPAGSVRVFVAKVPSAGGVVIRDLFFGPGWLVVDIEDGDVARRHFYASSPQGVREVLQVVIRGERISGAQVEWLPASRELRVTSQRRGIPPWEGCHLQRRSTSSTGGTHPRWSRSRETTPALLASDGAESRNRCVEAGRG